MSHSPPPKTAKNPFAPGFGRPPPFLGRRAEVDKAFDEICELLLDTDQPAPLGVYLYGPRGTGKTVHIRALREQIRQRTDPDMLLRLTADHVAQADNMRQELFRPRVEMTGLPVSPDASEPASYDKGVGEPLWSRLREQLLRLPLARTSIGHALRDMTATEARATVGFGSVTFTLPAGPDRSAGESLAQLGGPLLITLDEAHMVEPEALNILLNAVQDAGESMPVGLVLGGTPDLIDRLRKAGASFWSRGQRLPIGRLSHEVARDVIKHPLRGAAITYESSAIDNLVQAADHYPWFLQLYGQKAFMAVQQSDGRHFGAAVCQEAITQAHKARQNYYAELRQEFRSPEHRSAARTVALAFGRRQGVMTGIELEDMLTAMCPDGAAEHETRLRHTGFIVEGYEADTWEPGIPSFMDYMIRVTEPAPPSKPDSSLPNSQP